MSFAVGDDVAHVLYRSSSGFVGDERWSAEVPPVGSLSVTLRAVFLIHKVLSQLGAGRRSLRERAGNHKAHRTHCDCQRIYFHVAPHP